MIDICNFQIGIFMFRYFHNLLPSVFDHYFSFNYETHDQYTRSSSNYHLTGHMKGLYKFSIVQTGPRLWNSLPDEIKSKQYIFVFKKYLREYFVNLYC